MKKIITIVLIAGALALVYILATRDSNDTVNTVKEPVVETNDVEAACNSALAYMTFPDGESADVFLKECKEGKYPEVIERYRAEVLIESEASL